MWCHTVSGIWCWLLAVGWGSLSFPVTSHPPVGMAGLFHMIEEVFQEEQKLQNLLRSSFRNNPVCYGVNVCVPPKFIY